MTALVAPSAGLHDAWLAAHAEWGPGSHEDGFGLLPSDEVATPGGFAAWVARLHEASAPGDDGRPAAVFRWIVEDGAVLGGIALRRGDDELVRRAGHIGYGVRPSARRRGVATWALGRMVAEARRLGIDPVLLACEDGNGASAATIERNGGTVQGVRQTARGAVRIYAVHRVPIDRR